MEEQRADFRHFPCSSPPDLVTPRPAAITRDRATAASAFTDWVPFVAASGLPWRKLPAGFPHWDRILKPPPLARVSGCVRGG
ncbi:hypothetical protein GCM10010254_28410 [Streptomyces chromofuscus]|nr:hypothetical protein GCM10010254_28410 [Streptomyces chromofuscus]